VYGALAFRRESISPVAVLLSDLSVLSVDNELAMLATGDPTRGVDRLPLGAGDGGGALRAFAADGPTT